MIYSMLYSMKPSEREIGELKERISAQCKLRGLRYAEIGRLARVHPSQVWRICAGEFRTVSNNVVQVCKVLGVEVETVKGPDRDGDDSWDRLEGSLRNLWDRTPEGARRLKRILDAMAKLGNSSGRVD